MSKQQQKRDMHGVKGEGNPAADAEYRENLGTFMEEDDVQARAEQAREAVENDDGELAEAEQEGRDAAAEEDRLLH